MTVMQRWPLPAQADRKSPTPKKRDGVVWINAGASSDKPKPRPYKRKQLLQPTWAAPVMLLQQQSTAGSLSEPPKKKTNRKAFQVSWKAPTANFHHNSGSGPQINPIAFIPTATVANKKPEEPAASAYYGKEPTPSVYDLFDAVLNEEPRLAHPGPVLFHGAQCPGATYGPHEIQSGTADEMVNLEFVEKLLSQKTYDVPNVAKGNPFRLECEFESLMPPFALLDTSSPTEMSSSASTCSIDDALGIFCDGDATCSEFSSQVCDLF